MKSRKLLILLVCCLVLTGCTKKVPQEDYDTLQGEKKVVEENLAKAKEENTKLSGEYDTLKDQHETLKEEYDQYKESMKIYEEMTAAEAETRKAKAEKDLAKQKAEEKAAKEKAKKEAKAKAEAKAKQGYNTGITYSQLARTPDKYEGEKVKFRGKVLQVMEGSTVSLRLAVDSNYDKILYLTYPSSLVKSRILEDDIITIYGVSDGLYSYEATSGATITIPSVDVEKIDR